MPVRDPSKTCSIDGCDRPMFAREWCTMHYNRWRRDGDPGPVGHTTVRQPRSGTCAVDGCGAAIQARRLCNRHLKRLQTHGEPGPAESLRTRNAGNDCAVDGCERSAQKRGYCGMHYLRWRQFGDAGEPESRYLPPPADGICVVDGCETPARSKQLCPMHLSRFYKTGDVGSPDRIKAPAGTGRYVNDSGYVMVWCRKQDGSSGYRPEHRVVMERLIGRALFDHENVHHKNGKRDDNRAENLELWLRAQPPGQRIEDLVDFVVKHYPEYVRAALDGKPHLFA